MKKDNRGFLLAESLVVSTLVLTVIIFLFTQFKNVVVSQKRSYTYNSVEDIYTLGAMSDFLKVNEIELMQNGYIFENNNCTSVIPNGEIKTKCQNLAQSMNVDYIIFADSDLPAAKNYFKDFASQDLIDFVSRIDDPKIEFKGRLFAKFKNGNFATIIIERDPIPRMKSFGSNSFLGEVTNKENIISIDFLNEINIPEGATSWDVSEKGNQSVMAWIVPAEEDNTKYKLYIAGDGGVVAGTNSSDLFYNFTNLKSINFNDNFDTSKVANMSHMFRGCSSLTSLNLGNNFDTSNVNNMQYMFYGCSSLANLNLGNNFNTSKVTKMNHMFTSCSALTDLDLGINFDTAKVEKMEVMFSGCNELNNLNLGMKFDTKNVTNMSSMFRNCRKLTSLDLGDSFDTAKVEIMDAMFSGCNTLTTIKTNEKFVTTAVTSSTNMFSNCSKLVGGNGTAVATKKVYDKTYAKIDKAGQEGYFTLRG